MKINICDVCHGEGKTIESTHRIGIKKGPSSVRIDTCWDHKDVNKDKSFEEFSEYVKEINRKGWNFKFDIKK